VRHLIRISIESVLGRDCGLNRRRMNKYPIFLDAEKNEAINKYIEHICTESQIFASLTTGKGEEHELYTLQLMSLINPKIQNFGDAAEARLRMGQHIDDEIEEVLAIRKKHIGT
jgi:hypothetical protein